MNALLRPIPVSRIASCFQQVRYVRAIACLRASPVTLLSLLAAVSVPVTANDDVPREDLHYVGLLFTSLNHRSIGFNDESTNTTAGTVVIGGHLTDLFHAEFRFGAGISDGTVDDELEINVKHFESWYIGMHYPVTDYANVYGQFGFSHVAGDAKLNDAGQAREDDPDDASPYTDFVGKYPDSDFSISWIVGLDMELIHNGYLVLEGGRLFKDTGTDANTFQFSTGLRYEF